MLLDKIAAKCVELERRGSPLYLHAISLVTDSPRHCAKCWKANHSHYVSFASRRYLW